MTIKNYFHIIKNKIILILLFAIFLLSLIVRIIGLNWDEHQHLHPDERFLSMVSNDISLPSSIIEYFKTNQSPLNPFNYKQYQFFVYGTFPLFLTKFIAEHLNLGGYDQLYVVGRLLSSIFDSLNVIILFFLFKKISKSKKTLHLLLPSFLYVFTVLAIQLSHFFTVDTFLNTFILLTFTFFVYFCDKEKIVYLILAAISFGLAMSSKISAVYFLPIIGIFFLYILFNSKKIFKTVLNIILFLVLVFTTFRIFQPYAFTGLFNVNPLLIENYKSLSKMGSPDTVFPPSVQWLSKTRILFPIQNIILFGLGLPISISIILLSFKFLFKNSISLKKILIKSNFYTIVVIFWTLFLVIYQGLQFAHPMRYFFNIYPFLLIIFSLLILNLKISFKLISFILIGHLFWGLSFLTIYTHTNSRIEASYWMYKNINNGSSIKNEYWDDPLPLPLSNKNDFIYKNEQLSFYDQDTEEKWKKLNIKINESNYLIMSSNRLWASIPKVPLKYPITFQYYNDIFNEKLNFSLAKKIVSYPGFPLPIEKCFYFGPTDYPGSKFNNWFEIDDTCSYPGVYFRDDISDESFTVYDHPQVLIFKKN